MLAPSMVAAIPWGDRTKRLAISQGSLIYARAPLGSATERPDSSLTLTETGIRVNLRDMEGSTVAQTAPEPAAWRDGKRYAWLLGLIVPSLPFMAWAGVELTGLGVFWWLGPILVFGIFPLLDVLVGMDAENPPDSVIKWLEQDRYYRWCTYALHPGPVRRPRVRLLACGRTATCRPSRSSASRSRWRWSAGIAINTAHELGHKRASLERWLTKVALAQSGYGHFFIEHNRGHHVRVATPEDPASSRLGESFWAFLPRTVVGCLRSSWELEAERLRRMGSSPWTLQERHPQRLGDDASLLYARADRRLRLGRAAVPADPVGGRRLAARGRQLPRALRPAAPAARGRPLRASPRPEHSWNCNNVASNVLLYHLQRHSDHHANPMRRYQALRHVDEAPQLPTGYAGMIVLALVPPVWRRVMDQRAARPLRRRRDAREHPAARARGACSRRYGRRRRRPDGALAPAPAAATSTTRSAGIRARASRRHAVERGARRLGLPRLRRARQGRLRAGRSERRGCWHHGSDAPGPRAHPIRRRRAPAAARHAASTPRATSFSSAPGREITMADIARAAGVSAPDALQGVRHPRRVLARRS